jgi:hypothetical protein
MSLIVAKSTYSNPSGSSSSLILYGENVGTVIPPAPLGINSIVLGSGAQTAPTGTNSLAIGEQSLARIPGGVVQASGRFGSSGDAQAGKYLLRSHTVNGLETELFIDGTNGTQRLILPDDSTWTFKGLVTGHRTDMSDGHAGFSFEGVIYRVAGANSIAFQGHPSISVISRSNFFWKIHLYADDINGSLKICCEGQSGKVVRWVACVETVEITN